MGGDRVIAWLEYYPALTLTRLPHADAIVVLGGGVYRNAPEYGGDTVNSADLERLRYAAHLYRACRLPIIITGGHPGGGESEATVMRQVLQQDFNVPVQWVETAARTTWENAHNTRALLPKRIHTVFLVSQAWHLPRAVSSFDRAGFTTIPAGTGYGLTRPWRWSDLFPQPEGWTNSYLALHEIIGMGWYRIKSIVN